MNALNPGGLLAGRYQIIDRITTDLLNITLWSAQDQILDRPVRISIISACEDEALDSARRAALAQDRRLIRILDATTTAEGVSYVVTEACDGQTLSDIVTAGIVDPQQARAIVGEAATALEIARQRGIHHLALRPHSIIVDGSRVIVTGLGIDAGVAELNQRDSTVTSRADAQGLVALLYYAMTARWPGPSLDVPWIDPQAIQPLAARRHGPSVVSLSELRSDVPPELVALCDEALMNHDGSGERWDDPAHEGPATTEELVERLKPWGEVSIVAALPFFVRPEPPTVAGAGVGVNRQSVRSVFGSSNVPPGTPPPASPVRSSAGLIHLMGPNPTDPTPARSPQPAAVPQPATAPSPQVQQPSPPAPVAQYSAVPVPPRPAPAQQSAPTPAGDTTAHSSVANLLDGPSSTPPDEAPQKQRGGFNPTVIMLIVGLLVLIAGVVWGVGNAFSGFGPDERGDGTSSHSPSDTGTPDAGDTDPPSEAGAAPVIASGRSLDPSSKDGTGDHPEWVELALDGDPSTAWKTHTYNTADFGNLKPGLGYAIILQDMASVRSITLTTGNTGGRVEVRATESHDPTSGEVLDSQTLSSTTTLTFDQPVAGDSFVLWFSAPLPTATSDGGYRVEIYGIDVS